MTTPTMAEIDEIVAAVPTGTSNVLAMSVNNRGNITSIIAAAKTAKASAERNSLPLKPFSK